MDYDSYSRLPRHAKALDVGALTNNRQLISVAQAREFFVLTQWTEGTSFHLDLERLAKADRYGNRTENGRSLWRATWPKFMAENAVTRISTVGGFGN